MKDKVIFKAVHSEQKDVRIKSVLKQLSAEAHMEENRRGETIFLSPEKTLQSPALRC